MPVSAAREEFCQRPRKLPGMDGLPCVCRQLDGPQKHRVFGFEPGQRRCVIGKLLRHYPQEREAPR
jgi:hypothetical protein